MRYAVVVPMLAMFAFGLAPFAMARIGIIGCVLTLFVMAWVYMGLLVFYGNTGRAQEISDAPDASLTQKPSSGL
jgi:hypothetical protein